MLVNNQHYTEYRFHSIVIATTAQARVNGFVNNERKNPGVNITILLHDICTRNEKKKINKGGGTEGGRALVGRVMIRWSKVYRVNKLEG